MRVFVWIDHGEVDVYAANTHKQLVGIAEEVAYRCKSYLDCGEDIERECLLINTRPVQVIYNLIELAGDDQELFQHGTGFEDLIDMEEH